MAEYRSGYALVLGYVFLGGLLVNGFLGKRAVDPACPKAGCGRHSRELEIILRVYYLPLWYTHQ